MNYNVLPDDLKDRGRFCTWRYEDRNGRRTKIPYHPISGEAARSNDPGSFVSFEEAVQANGYDGIGVGIFDGLCAVDLDDCITDSGYIKQPAADIISLMHSQTSIDMTAVIGIDVLAVCLQGKFLIRGTLGYTEPLSLYTVVIAAPGERKSRAFMQEAKIMYTELIKQFVPEEDRLQVFDPSAPHLPTKKIGKNNPLAAVISSTGKNAGP